jgi:hypothetical protein
MAFNSSSEFYNFTMTYTNNGYNLLKLMTGDQTFSLVEDVRRVMIAVKEFFGQLTLNDRAFKRIYDLSLRGLACFDLVRDEVLSGELPIDKTTEVFARQIESRFNSYPDVHLSDLVVQGLANRAASKLMEEVKMSSF